MQTEPVAVDGVAGPVAVTVNEAWKKPQITVSGQSAPFLGRRQYALPAADGSTIRATLRRQIASPYPTLEVRGVKYRTGPKTPLTVLLLMVLPILLMLLMLPIRMVRPTLLGLIGSVPGVIVGVLGLAVNIAVARTEMSTVGKSCLMIGIAGAVAAVSYVIMAVVAAGSVGALPWAADRLSSGRYVSSPSACMAWKSRKNSRPGRSRRSPSIAPRNPNGGSEMTAVNQLGRMSSIMRLLAADRTAEVGGWLRYMAGARDRGSGRRRLTVVAGLS